MRSSLESVFHNYQYLLVKTLALMDVFGTERAVTQSAFRRKYGSGFQTRYAETQLPPVVILLKIAGFAFMRWSHKGSNFRDSQRSMQFRLTE